MSNYVIQCVDNQLVIVADSGKVVDIKVLDKFRVRSTNNQIGIRVFDEQWKMWVIKISEVKEGVDVTDFINNQ